LGACRAKSKQVNKQKQCGGKIPKFNEFTRDAPSSDLRSEAICVAPTAVFVEPEKLYDFYIGTFIKFKHLSWLGHLQFMDVARNTKKCTKPSYTIKDVRRDPKVRWKDDVKNDGRRMGIN
jgi:hypothetical protein